MRYASQFSSKNIKGQFDEASDQGNRERSDYRQIQSWTTAALPPDWMAIRDRWEFYHGLRTLVSLAALACLFVSTLLTGWRSAPDRQAQRDERP